MSYKPGADEYAAMHYMVESMRKRGADPEAIFALFAVVMEEEFNIHIIAKDVSTLPDVGDAIH